jgi:hypothetical protein
MEDDGIFYTHVVYFTFFCSILWAFGIVRGNLVYFSPFWYFVPRQIWQPYPTPSKNHNIKTSRPSTAKPLEEL